MSPVAQGDIMVSDGDHEVDVAEHEVRLIRHRIRSGPEVSSNGCSVAEDKSMDDVHNVLDSADRGIGS
jgi:hypothetical protein